MGTRGEHREGAFGATGGRWRAVLLLLPLAVFVIGLAGLIGLLGALSASFRERGFLPVVRAWGRVPLWALGIKLDVHGLEHRDSPGAKIVLFNHVSVLDLFVLSALSPKRPLVLYKKEFERVPGLGRALSGLGMIPVDRSNHEAALASVEAARTQLAAETDAAVMIAPEGTRSRLGGLQEFKLGAFHLAASTGVPIVPLIMRGIDSVLPMGSLLARSGVVRVDFLPPIPTKDWSSEEVREHAREVREVFLEYLEPTTDSANRTTGS